MKAIKPKRLKPGDTIGIVASSLPVLPSFRENYEKGKRVIKDLGFRVKEGETIGKTKWWMAATPKEVAEDINSMFADENVKAIMAQTGGYSAIGVLEHLDYQLIKRNPKPFLGMSDMTVYHLAILAKVGMVGFHMDDVTFGMGWNWQKNKEWDKFGREAFIKLLTSPEPYGEMKPLSGWECWKKGKASGHLIGGILQHQRTLSGTEYYPKEGDFKGAILFWEEVGVELYSIAQSLYKLKYMGVLNQISGMIVGKIKYIKPMREEEIKTPSDKELVLDILKEYDFPILSNVDFGHFTVNIPMPLGIKVEMDATKKALKFLEGAVI